jgi:hypothetical protein
MEVSLLEQILFESARFVSGKMMSEGNETKGNRMLGICLTFLNLQISAQ